MDLTQSLPYPTVDHVMNVTAFKDEATAKAAIRTLKWFDDGAPHHVTDLDELMFYNIGQYITPNYKKTLDSRREIGCGTACCIAGAIRLFRDGSQEEQLWSSELYSDFNVPENLDLVRLFYPWRDEFHETDYHNPYNVAATFRKYLFTGKIDWKP